MRLKIFLLGLICLFGTQISHALNDRHLIIIQPGETELSVGDLSSKGREQVKQMADSFLAHGFDNRSISAVYISTSKSALSTCEILSDIGIFSTSKIRMDPRLSEEDNEEQFDLLTLYDQAEKNHPKGHIVFVTHAKNATKLIADLTQAQVKLECAQPYIVPLTARVQND